MSDTVLAKLVTGASADILKYVHDTEVLTAVEVRGVLIHILHSVEVLRQHIASLQGQAGPRGQGARQQEVGGG